MPYYRCTFCDTAGKVFHRDVFAGSRSELAAQYPGDGNEKLISTQRLFGVNRSLKNLFSRRIRYGDFLLFNQKLAVLLRAGSSFIRSLEVILEGMRKGALREVVSRALRDVRNGVQISDALNSPQLPYVRIYRASLLAGEGSGNLDSMLRQFNNYLERVNNLRRKTVSSLTYPAILFVLMIVMVGAVMVFVIPRFSEFYGNFSAQMPAITMFFIQSSLFLKAYAPLFIAVLVVLVLGVRLAEKLNPELAFTDWIKLRVPFSGSIIRERAFSVFSRTLSILISGGVTVPDAAEVAVSGITNRWLFLRMRNVPEEIRSGRLLSDVLAGVPDIPPITVELTRVGDSSGNLPEVLDQNSEFLEASIDMKVASVISLIEPVVIVILGLVIAFLLLSIYLPIFNTVQVVR
ncbi:MAG: type II secretion system F family protein [Acidobacteriota bacterium]|jgi:type IV pilus assembly protein PilC|nr:type II secretion system F family protein [Acidobacteriota bacterium]